MFKFYFGELTEAQKTDIDVATDCILNVVLGIGKNKKLMGNEKVAAKYDKLSDATIVFIDTVYKYRIDDIKISAHNLKKAISNFGYDAVKVDKRASNSINNMKFKRNIDFTVTYLEDIFVPEKEKVVLE